ncbi:MAG: hypothetical protein AAGJ10_05650 [Bacteroidota bacterium]
MSNPPALADLLGSAPAPLTVAVLLGDPRRADPVKLGGVFDEDDFFTIDEAKRALNKLPGYRFLYLDDHDTLFDDLRRLSPDLDLVLNLCDEGFDNRARWELHVAALLDVFGIPYSGAGPTCLGACYDKSLVRGIAREMGVPVPVACFMEPGQHVVDLDIAAYPVIVKPNAGDSSVGITQKSIAYNPDELTHAIASVRAAVGDQVPLLVETFLRGKDLTVGIIGNPGNALVLPITEEDYSALPAHLPRLCGYEAKWLADSPYMHAIESVRADLPVATADAMTRHSLRLFERLGCRDYARFDWRLDAAGRPYLLEANPNPGWCWDGHLAKQAAWAGYDYTAFFGLILAAAMKRVGTAST